MLVLYWEKGVVGMDNGGGQTGRVDAPSNVGLNKSQPDIEASKRFIETNPVLGDALRLPGVPGGYVIGQNVTIVQGLSPEPHEAVAQALAYANLYADGAPTNADLQTWYRRYFQALQQTRLWIPAGPLSWATVSDTHAGLTVHSAILKVVEGFFAGTGAVVGPIKDSLTALTADPNSSASWFTLFDSASRRLNVPSCQITVVTHDANAPVRLYILVFALDVQQVNGQFLFFRFTSHHETFKFCSYRQEIDEGGLQGVLTVAPVIAARIGSLGPTDR